MSVERRSSMRFNTAIDGTFHMLGAGINGLFITDNFCKGGFKATFNQRVTQNSRLECEMTFPETMMPFFATGKVVWVKEAAAPCRFEAGVQLKDMDPVEQQFLMDYCFKKWNQDKKIQDKTEFNLD